MIVDCAVYQDGCRAADPGDFSDALEAARAAGDAFLWLGLYEPTTEELNHVTSEFALHELAVEDAVQAHQRPKLDRYADHLFVVLKTLHYEEATSTIATGELMLFVGDGFVVTVRHGPGSPLREVRRRLEKERDILRRGPSAVLYAVCDAVVDAYTEIAAEVEADLEEVEAQVFSATRNNAAEQIYSLKREVLEFRRAVVPLAEPVRTLAQDEVPYLAPATRPFFTDVHDHLLRAVEQVESFDHLLTDILAANLAQVSVRQNEDMRRISAWVAIVAVPTMIAGIYGMNFRRMPELQWKWGYPGALTLMLGSCLALYRVFKNSGWL